LTIMMRCFFYTRRGVSAEIRGECILGPPSA
jgi:hypothetical protein